MSEDKIKIRLPNAREKLQPLFPEDNRGDVRIVFGKRSFKLQKAFLRLESGFFKKTFAQPTEILEVKQDFQEGCFANVLKCFYGFTIQVPRAEILDYYPIIKYLEVESLLKVLREDIAARPDRYDVFVLLQLAHRFNEQELFELSLAQLEKEGYQQLRTARASLLRCPTQLFKMLVKTHNRVKAEKSTGVSYLQVDGLIRDFSEAKKLGEAQYQQLKFELIDKKSLNAQEYKQIFLDDVKKKGEEYRSMMKLSPEATTLYNSAFSNNIFSASKLTESVIEPIKKMNDELALELENTYEKKKNEELQAENALLANELANVKTTLTEYATSFAALKDVVSRLQAKLEEKDRVDKEQSTIIKKLEKTCQDLRTEVSSGRSDTVKKLQERVAKLEKQPEKRLSGNPKYIPYDEEEDESKTIQSQIVPGHLLKQIAKPAAEALSAPPASGFKKAKSQPPPAVVVAEAKIEEELDEDELEQMYSSRLEFDREPLGCRKNFLPKLANFLTTDGFQKKKLRLLYRRHTSKDQCFGQPADIRNRNSLLFIILTKINLVFGGFISIQIGKNAQDYLSDENAFLFSLSKNEKCAIKKSHIGEAVFISNDYLIGFSNDVMISLDPIKIQSECAFPDAYDNNKEPRSPRWLTGEDSSFSIRCIEVYEVREEEMIMDL